MDSNNATRSKSVPRLMLALCSLLAGATLLGAATAAYASDSCAGVTLPETMQAFGQSLVRNGVGLREATFLDVDVYVAGLYLQHRTHSVNEILRPEQSKVITLRFVRDVSRSEMIDALDEALQKNAGNDYAEAHRHMERFVGRLPPLREGTQLTLAYGPKHGVELSVNGRALGVDRDDKFGNLVFRAWLGPRPPDKDLKAGLLGGPCK